MFYRNSLKYVLEIKSRKGLMQFIKDDYVVSIETSIFIQENKQLIN